MAVLPRAVPHTFQVVSETARFVNVTASPTTTPRFDAMVSALGSPTDACPPFPSPATSIPPGWRRCAPPTGSTSSAHRLPHSPEEMKMTRIRYGLACLGVVALVACGGGTAAETTATNEAAPTESVIEVTAVDFGFENLPERIPAGTTLTLVNESPVELHELVAVRLPEDETRTVEELLASPEDLGAYFASVTTVVIAPPGERAGWPSRAPAASTSPAATPSSVPSPPAPTRPSTWRLPPRPRAVPQR
jgi:hypothetical protein